MKKIITTDKAPGAIGPYSQAVEIGRLLFTSGQLGIDPATGQMPEGIEAQTDMVLRNVQAILQDRGLDLTHVVKALIFIRSMDDFAVVNNVYSQYFTDNYPARSCVEVSRLPKDALVEIEVIAHL